MVETWDVMGPSQWFTVLTDDGSLIKARTYSVRRAVVIVQEMLATIDDEAMVTAVYDGNNVYMIGWD